MTHFSHKRRHFLKTAACTASSLLGTQVSLLSLFAREQEEPVKIGYLPITDATPLLVAHGKGYFKDEGLKTERPTMIRSWSALSESFFAGKFNLTHMLFPMPVWMRYNNRTPVKVIAWNHLNGSAITVGHDSGIERFADLGGKQIAVPYWYSMHNIILQMGIRRMGLTPVIRPQSSPLKKNEVNLFILPPPDMPLALAGRKIDGYIVAEPFNAIGEVKVKARIMRFVGDIWKNHPCCVVVMKEQLIHDRPVFTQKVASALVRAQKWITDHPLETARLLSREGDRYLPVPEDVLKRVFTFYDPAYYSRGTSSPAIKHPEWGIRRIGFQPYPFPSATRFIVEEMRHTVVEGDSGFLKSLDTDHVVGDLVDDRFVKKAVEQLGGPGIFGELSLTDPWLREEVISI